jgi:hypothetical protein
MSPWARNHIAKLQDSYSVSFTFDMTDVNPVVLGWLFGPLYALAWQASFIDPHWYLRGDE